MREIIKPGKLILYFLQIYLICVVIQSCGVYLIYESDSWFFIMYLFVFLWIAPTTTITLFIVSAITKNSRWVKNIIYNILGSSVMIVAVRGAEVVITNIEKYQLFPIYLCYVKPSGAKALNTGWVLLFIYLISSFALISFALVLEYFVKKKIFSKRATDSNKA